MKKFFILLSFLSQLFAHGQTLEENLVDHVTYLADDKLEGRLTGSKGEKIAARYIAKEFMEFGVQAAGDGDKNYVQEFSFLSGRKIADSNYIKFSDTQQKQLTYILNDSIQEDFFPLNFSANGKVSGKLIDCGFGIIAPEFNYNDYENKNIQGNIALIKISTPSGSNPHSDYFKYIDERDKVKNAINQGATGVVLIHTAEDYPELEKDYAYNISLSEIPVVYCTKKISSIIQAGNDVHISVDLPLIRTVGNNLIGFIDNQAENTIIIGAHYDHLGYNELGGSLYRGTPAIHNGADDNASGVALIIELARKLKSSDLKKNNYLIIAFSGEEEGLFGSSSFAKSALIKKYQPNFMLNFDMVGRLDTSNILFINGIGTSPSWGMLSKINQHQFILKTTESGTGPSDHTSFYLQDIPVLHLFTGSHEDYHKPTDDINKINFEGIESILNFTYLLIDSLDEKGKIQFTKTKEQVSAETPAFKVTLGVIPDYAFEGKGMRIDGVSDGKPASRAGLLAGDVVIALDDHEVFDMMSYMKALSYFAKGDSVFVSIMRNNQLQKVSVTF